jgi:hypothetical protein
MMNILCIKAKSVVARLNVRMDEHSLSISSPDKVCRACAQEDLAK